MTTIKGGVTILPNSDNKEFLEKLEDAGVKIKMPFKATGFKASKIPKCVDLTGIEFADKPQEPKKPKSIRSILKKKVKRLNPKVTLKD